MNFMDLIWNQKCRRKPLNSWLRAMSSFQLAENREVNALDTASQRCEKHELRAGFLLHNLK